MGIVGKLLGGDLREEFKKRIDQLVTETDKMLETDKTLITSIRDHTKAIRELRLTLKELKDSL